MAKRFWHRALQAVVSLSLSTPVYPVNLKFAVTGYVYTTINYYYFNLLATMLTPFFTKWQRNWGCTWLSQVLLLVFVPCAPLVPCGPGVFCFFRAKSVDRRLIGRIKIITVGKMQPCTGRWGPWCGSAERPTSIANCELHGGRLERDVGHAHFTSKWYSEYMPGLSFHSTTSRN